MLDDNPVLKERLMAFGAFAGIAVFAIAAVDVLVTGGFDFGAERAPYYRDQPSAYVRMADAAEYVSDRVQHISWDDAFTIGEAEAATTEELAGENDGSPPPEAPGQTSDDELSQAIGALYAEQPADYEDYAEEASPDETPADEQQIDDEKLASASETASPW